MTFKDGDAYFFHTRQITKEEFDGIAYGVPRKLKCADCQLGEHCNGADENCYCECTTVKDSPI